MPDFSELESVELKNGWANEGTDFTPWLAQEENLKLLGKTLNMELEIVSTEASVGRYRADIVCTDTTNDTTVLIENQLQRTDHKHIGQVLTYAAGLNAVSIIWIAAEFTDEHRAALDWFNNITEANFRFFGLEVELWRIGDSAIAPKFNVVSKPNDWSRSVRQATQQGDMSEREKLLLEFWSGLRDRLQDRDSRIKSQTPKPQSWAVFAIGKAGVHLRGSVSQQKGQLQVALVVDHQEHSVAYFGLLDRERQEIEDVISEPLNWVPRPPGKHSVISLTKNEVNPANKDDWQNQFKWMTETLEKFDEAFRGRLQDLVPSDWVPDDGQFDDDE